MKLYCCDACKYLFESSKEEIKEYQDRVLENEDE